MAEPLLQRELAHAAFPHARSMCVPQRMRRDPGLVKTPLTAPPFEQLGHGRIAQRLTGPRPHATHEE